MATKKKNKKKLPQKSTPQAMSPRQYIQSGRARTLEIAECLINEDWQERGMATLVVARKHKTGNVTFGIYLIDTFCLGLKNTSCAFNRFEDDYENFIEHTYAQHGSNQIEIDYDLAHNIVYGAVNYAANLGFKPQKDWADSQFILKPANSKEVEKMDIEFGKDGQPFFIAGPYDNSTRVIAQLEKTAGQGNYHYVAGLGSMGDFGDAFFSAHNEDDEDDLDDDDDFDGENDDEKTEDVDFEEVK